MSIYVEMMKAAINNNDVYKMKSVIQSSLEDQKDINEFNELLDLVTNIPNFWDSSDQTNFPDVSNLTEAQAQQEFIDENAKLPDDFSKDRVAFLKQLLLKTTEEPVAQPQKPVESVEPDSNYQESSFKNTAFQSEPSTSGRHLDKGIVLGGAVALSAGVVTVGIATAPIVLTAGKVLGVAGGIAIIAGGAVALSSRRYR